MGKRSVRFLSTIIEVQVQAHVRRIQRQRYHKGCRCPQRPGIVTAPPAPRRIPKSPIGVSVWAEVLLDKYLYGRPTARLCQVLQQHGVPLSQGTVTDGLRQITPLFEPVVQALHERQMGEKLFHGDETRWEVFATLEGKVGHRWYLWVTRSATEYLPNFLYRALKRQMLHLSVYNRTKMPATLKSIYFRLTGLAHYAIHPSTLITRDRSEPQG